MSNPYISRFLYALFLLIQFQEASSLNSLAQMQMSNEVIHEHREKKNLKKKEFVHFKHLFSLKKEEIALFEQSFAQSPEKIKAVVSELVNKTELSSKFKTLLLTGPSGSGKSLLAQSIAYYLGRSCEVVHAPSLLGHFRDQAAEKVKDLFKRMRKDPRKPVLVLEEINALTDDHTSEHSDTKHTAMQLWTCIDKYKKKKNFLLIATTNITKKMPHQLQSRFEGKTFNIEHPSYQARKNALDLYLKEVITDESCNEEYIVELAKRLNDFSQRAIEALVDNAKLLAGIGAKPASKRVVSKEHLEQAYASLVTEKDKFWDFKEHTTDEERRHRENTAMSERHFKESQERQILIAEWHMIFNAIIKDQEIQSPIPLNKGIDAINEAKKIVFPQSKSASKIKVLQEPGRLLSGKYAVVANTEKEKQESSIRIIPVKVNNESK